MCPLLDILGGGAKVVLGWGRASEIVYSARKPDPWQNGSVPKPDTEEAVLTKSARRCCLCFHLKKDFREKRGQIAHLDRNPSNDAEDNLAFLCFDHHTEYDSRASQHKNYTVGEVKKARNKLYVEVDQYKPRDWVLVLHGKFADFHKADVEAVAKHLQALLGDARLTIDRIASGSVKLYIQSSASALEKIQQLVERGASLSVGGHLVERVERPYAQVWADLVGRALRENKVKRVTIEMDAMNRYTKRLVDMFNKVKTEKDAGYGAVKVKVEVKGSKRDQELVKRRVLGDKSASSRIGIAKSKDGFIIMTGHGEPMFGFDVGEPPAAGVIGKAKKGAKESGKRD